MQRNNSNLTLPYSIFSPCFTNVENSDAISPYTNLNFKTSETAMNNYFQLESSNNNEQLLTKKSHINDFGDLELPNLYPLSSEDRRASTSTEQSKLSDSSKKIFKLNSSGLQKGMEKKLFGRTKGSLKIRNCLWKPSEDAQLLELVQENGYQWAYIAKQFKNKTINDIRDRYRNSLAVQNIHGKNMEENLVNDRSVINIHIDQSCQIQSNKFSIKEDTRPNLDVRNGFAIQSIGSFLDSDMKILPRGINSSQPCANINSSQQPQNLRHIGGNVVCNKHIDVERLNRDEEIISDEESSNAEENGNEGEGQQKRLQKMKTDLLNKERRQRYEELMRKKCIIEYLYTKTMKELTAMEKR